MKLIVKLQNKLINILKVEKADILKKMKQIHKKDDVVGNYMNKGLKSIFVDKDT